MPRLGEGLYSSGTLNPTGKKETRDFFRRLPRLCERHRVDRVLIGATSALREARDGTEFISELEQICEHKVRLLSGEQEALLTAQGILLNEKNLEGEYLLVDIGGGSTEISELRDKTISAPRSILLGAIRENHTFLQCEEDDCSPPSTTAISNLRKHIGTHLQEHLPGVAYDKIIGSSGTVRSLCKLRAKKRRKASTLTASELNELTHLLCTCDFETRCKIEGIERNRADIIVAGAIILEEISKHVGASSIRASIFSLRHGLLDEAIRGSSD